ncbi:MAG: HK97 family phage prohead protease [Acidobacteriota bacterium]|nr:HK97 family phage prohead protease [Acidobacteriota bacterium]
MKRRKHLVSKFLIKELTENGMFKGLAAVYGNVDLGGDVIEPGAFTKTLSDKGGEFPILWQHDSRKPIGLGKFTDSREGLVVEGKLTLESPTAAEAYALLRDRVVRGLSIGYDTISDKIEKNIRHLLEIKLWETSLVTFPMNEMAQITDVKNADEYAVLVNEVEAAGERLGFNAELAARAIKSLRALAARAPAAKQDTIAPDVVHAVVTSLAKEIESWTRKN